MLQEFKNKFAMTFTVDCLYWLPVQVSFFSYLFLPGTFFLNSRVVEIVHELKFKRRLVSGSASQNRKKGYLICYIYFSGVEFPVCAARVSYSIHWTDYLPLAQRTLLHQIIPALVIILPSLVIILTSLVIILPSLVIILPALVILLPSLVIILPALVIILPV